MRAETAKLVPKPWGYEKWFVVTDKYVGKFLYINAGHELSKQLHERKLETLYMLDGSAIVSIWDEPEGTSRQFDFPNGMCYTISPRRIHRISSKDGCMILEISTPEIEDVVRFEDRYGRA
jgi:mannose-6-phosphate isomerase-like protein (cupin superfamily)